MVAFTMTDPLFSSYAFYGGLVGALYCAKPLLVVGARVLTSTFGTPEDHKFFCVSDKTVEKNNATTPMAVTRARANHLNDLENIPMFLIAGLIYIGTNPELACANLVFRVFTVARFAHSAAHLLALPQPSRALLFTTGHLCTMFMVYSILCA
eukprot:Nk52_evm16s1636 gene=Nk52_evmTU16s1636